MALVSKTKVCYNNTPSLFNTCSRPSTFSSCNRSAGWGFRPAPIISNTWPCYTRPVITPFYAPPIYSEVGDSVALCMVASAIGLVAVAAIVSAFSPSQTCVTTSCYDNLPECWVNAAPYNAGCFQNIYDHSCFTTTRCY